jgi:hypothetical protein
LSVDAVGWYILQGVTADSTLNNNFLFDNIKCQGIQRWEEAPNHNQMVNVLFDLFAPDRNWIREIPEYFFPPASGTSAKAEITDAMTEEEKKAARKEAKKASGKIWFNNFRRHVQRLNLQDEGEKMMATILTGAFPCSAFINLGPDEADRIAELRVNNVLPLFSIEDPQWIDTLFSKKTDGSLSVKQPGKHGDNPDNRIINAKLFVDSQRFFVSPISGEEEYTPLLIHVNNFDMPLPKAFGILHFNQLEHLILPRLQSNQVRLSIQATITVADTVGMMASTHKFDESKRRYECLSMYSSDIRVDMRRFIRDHCIPISTSLALDTLAAYVKMVGGDAKPNLQSITSNVPSLKRYIEWFDRTNPFNVATNNGLVNIFEHSLTWSRKNTRHQFYVLINHVFADQVRDYFDMPSEKRLEEFSQEMAPILKAAMQPTQRLHYHKITEQSGIPVLPFVIYAATPEFMKDDPFDISVVMPAAVKQPPKQPLIDQLMLEVAAGLPVSSSSSSSSSDTPLIQAQEVESSYTKTESQEMIDEPPVKAEASKKPALPDDGDDSSSSSSSSSSSESEQSDDDDEPKQKQKALQLQKQKQKQQPSSSSHRGKRTTPSSSSFLHKPKIAKKN